VITRSEEHQAMDLQEGEITVSDTHTHTHVWFTIFKLYYVVVVVDVTFKLTGFLKTTVYKCDGRHYLSL